MKIFHKDGWDAIVFSEISENDELEEFSVEGGVGDAGDVPFESE